MSGLAIASNWDFWLFFYEWKRRFMTYAMRRADIAYILDQVNIRRAAHVLDHACCDHCSSSSSSWWATQPKQRHRSAPLRGKVEVGCQFWYHVQVVHMNPLETLHHVIHRAEAISFAHFGTFFDARYCLRATSVTLHCPHSNLLDTASQSGKESP